MVLVLVLVLMRGPPLVQEPPVMLVLALVQVQAEPAYQTKTQGLHPQLLAPRMRTRRQLVRLRPFQRLLLPPCQVGLFGMKGMSSWFLRIQSSIRHIATRWKQKLPTVHLPVQQQSARQPRQQQVRPPLQQLVLQLQLLSHPKSRLEVPTWLLWLHLGSSKPLVLQRLGLASFRI
jgi:hypothetical protein